MSPFDDALTLVLELEGGRVDDPHDPGGRTNQGITQATYDAWRLNQDLPRRDVFGIVASEVAAIYRHDYADPLRFDQLPSGVGFAVFDAGVNSGVWRAARWLQAALRCPVDGSVGTLTVAACRGTAPAPLVHAICDARLGLMRHLPTWSRFGTGWSRRVAFVRAHALSMAGQAGAETTSAQGDVTCRRNGARA